MIKITYSLNENIFIINLGKTNRYINGIASTIKWLHLVRKYIASEKCGFSFIYIESACSLRHYLRIFKTIIMAINNPSKIAKATFDYIEKTKQKVEELIPSKNNLDNGTEVPYISLYKLVIRIIISYCTRA